MILYKGFLIVSWSWNRRLMKFNITTCSVLILRNKSWLNDLITLMKNGEYGKVISVHVIYLLTDFWKKRNSNIKNLFNAFHFFVVECFLHYSWWASEFAVLRSGNPQGFDNLLMEPRGLRKLFAEYESAKIYEMAKVVVSLGRKPAVKCWWVS